MGVENSVQQETLLFEIGYTDEKGNEIRYTFSDLYAEDTNWTGTWLTVLSVIGGLVYAIIVFNLLSR